MSENVLAGVAAPLALFEGDTTGNRYFIQSLGIHPLSEVFDSH
jgi:hypothetical protein